MPKFRTFKFGQEKFGEKPPRFAHLPTRTEPAFGIPLFGHAIFGRVKFGDYRSVEMLTADQGPITQGPRARKAIGRRIIYRIRYGKQEQYKYTIPTNPQTEDQQANRSKFATAVAAWQALTEDQKNTWRKEALGSTIPGYQFFLRKEMEK